MASALPDFIAFSFNGHRIEGFAPATILNARILAENAMTDPEAIIDLHAEARRNLIKSGITSQNFENHLAITAEDEPPLYYLPLKLHLLVALDVLALSRLVAVSIIRNSSHDINITIGEFIKNNIPPSILAAAGFFSMISRENLIKHIIPALRTIQHDPPLQRNSHIATITALASHVTIQSASLTGTPTEAERRIDFTTIANNIDLPYFSLCPDWYFFHVILAPFIFQYPSNEITQEEANTLYKQHRTDLQAVLNATHAACSRAYMSTGVAINSIPSTRQDDVSDAIIYNTLAIAKTILTSRHIDKRRDIYRDIITVVTATAGMGFSRVKSIYRPFHRSPVDLVDISIRPDLFKHVANIKLNDFFSMIYQYSEHSRSPFAIPINLTNTSENTIQSIYHHTFAPSDQPPSEITPACVFHSSTNSLPDDDAVRALLLFRDPGVYTSMVAMAAMGLIEFPRVSNPLSHTMPTPMFDTLCPIMWSHILHLQQTLLPLAREQYHFAVGALFTDIVRALFYWTEVYLPLPGDAPLPVEVALFIQTLVNIRRYAIADTSLTKTLFLVLNGAPHTATAIVRRYFFPVPDSLEIRVADMDEVGRIQRLQSLATSSDNSDEDIVAPPVRSSKAPSVDKPFPQPVTRDDLHASMRINELRPHNELIIHADRVLTPIFAPNIPQIPSTGDAVPLTHTLLYANMDKAREYIEAQRVNKAAEPSVFAPVPQPQPLRLTQPILDKITKSECWEPRETGKYPPNWMSLHCTSFRNTHLIRKNAPSFIEQTVGGTTFVMLTVPPTSSTPQTATIGKYTYTYIDYLYPPHSDLNVRNYFYSLLVILKSGTPEQIAEFRQTIIKLFPELGSVSDRVIVERLTATFNACVSARRG